MPDRVTHSTGSFTSRGLSLYVQRWIPAQVQADLVIVHGGGEHSGRYAETASRLAQEGFAVHSFDLEGHGRSPGKRGHVRAFDDLVADVRAFIELVASGSTSPRPILLGHSLGGLISTYYAAEHPQSLRCLILSSPLWDLSIPVPAWKRLVAHALSTWWPSLTMRRPSAGAQVLSHDPEVGRRYTEDPLVHFKASVRFYVELRRALADLPQVLPRLQLPVLALQAGDDRIASARATAQLFPLLASAQNRLIVYDGYYHEVLNEVGKAQVIQDLLAWVRTVG